MADEDLIFCLEGVDGGRCSRAGHNADSDTDSDDDEGYFICPITDDHMSNQNVSSKVQSYYSNLTKTECGSTGSPASSFHFKEAWKHAIEKAKHMPDPWAEFHLEDIATEHATRHRYNAVTGEWLKDEVLIKMASQPFGRGAMRECFRTKKLSNFLHAQQWKGASNYVAKRYIEPVDRSVYFEDVQLQMEAKLWGEDYNRHKPPKQVDIMQMCIIELKDRPGQPLFHLEHYIEGKYIKYNSNSGFVRDDNIRLTPQAFSHFTFERSGHQLIVVDIQGVGDLYTDPQIHTEKGTDFGDGNLGVRGMALFFYSHACNRICQSMGLTPFDLSPREQDAVNQSTRLLQSAKTILRGTEEKCGSPRIRTLSSSRPPLLLRLSENSGDENMSDVTFDSLPSSPSSATPHSQKLDHLHWPVFGDLDNMGPRDHDRMDNHRDSENSGDSGYPSEKRSDLDDPEPREHGHSNGNRRHESDEDSLGSSGRETEENKTKGFDYLLKAAEAGDRHSMILVARAFDTGLNLSPDRCQDWSEALHWYNTALETTDCDEGGEYDGIQDEPQYALLAREAEMLLTGGFGLDKNPQRSGDLYTQAAEAAMEAMKGRLANQYYEKAEEAWAQMEE
ncbi:eukaryotic elongation factor 2 kinase isoform c [Mus musculus]|nr:eukaryotic elongation factor 2 kinase isoform c [Mus musculus]NP_001399262.1 eukaryotic elongation factor 2 kinase isoform c [Mus musculus]EDL17230.1 eukaryotic elongation factor-2 kinase, isoform CRA_c [Mus musculus]|eukprot:XP_006507408.1 PREDICTED: eukaryotic elongation factor 2 kinase isoform X3 [Mus musculus]